MNPLNYILLCFLVCFSNNSTLPKEIAGKYVIKIYHSSDVGPFGRTLTLNCDSTVIATFSGDLINEIITGHWILYFDTLTINFDSSGIERPYGHWNKTMKFQVDKKQLLLLNMEINGEKITDKKLLKEINQINKKTPFVMVNRIKCN